MRGNRAFERGSGLLAAMFLGACAQLVDPSGTAVVTTTPTSSPAATLSAALPRDVVAVRAYSAGFGTHPERTDRLPPDLVIFSDGLVVARVDIPSEAARYQGIRIDEGTLSAVQAAIDADGVHDVLVPYDLSFHTTESMTIIRVRKSDGTVIDVAAVALEGRVLPPPSEVPGAVVELDATLIALRDRVREGAGIEWSRDLPEVPGVFAPID